MHSYARYILLKVLFFTKSAEYFQKVIPILCHIFGTISPEYVSELLKIAGVCFQGRMILECRGDVDSLVRLKCIVENDD